MINKRSIILSLFLFVIGGFMLSSQAQSNKIIPISAPEIISIKIIDNKEPLIDLKNQKEIAFGPSPEIPDNTNYTKMRQTVYDKLIQAQKALPKGLHFCIYEAYRSLDLQKFLFDNRYAKVKKLHPDWSEDELFAETIKLVSPVTNQDGSHNIPPHSTGGAIDIYLIDDKGAPIDMGIHPKDWMEDTDGSLSLTDSKRVSAEAHKNRNILSKVLSDVGFINYPTEYWHWSYGDRYWAYHANTPHAIYNSYQEKSLGNTKGVRR